MGELPVRWLLFCCLASLLAACGSVARQDAAIPVEVAASAPATSTANPASAVAPEAVAAALTGTESLESAAAQFAGVLGVQADEVRVRIQGSGCSVCSIETRARLASLEGLSVGEAAPLIENDMTFWLFVDGLVCKYALLSDVYTPRTCRTAP